MLLVALGYIASATQIEMSFIMDPLGPRFFPILIGAILGVAALVPIFKPDPDPQWPGLKVTLKLILSVIVLVLYALLLKPLGFIAATAIVASILSYQIHPNWLKAIAVGVALAVILFLAFKYFLGLSLFALPESMLR